MNAIALSQIAVWLACGVWNSAAIGAEYRRPSLHEACGTHDVLAVTLLEDASSDPEMDRDLVAEAVWALIEARLACRKGQVQDALRLYDVATLPASWNGRRPRP